MIRYNGRVRNRGIARYPTFLDEWRCKMKLCLSITVDLYEKEHVEVNISSLTQSLLCLSSVVLAQGFFDIPIVVTVAIHKRIDWILNMVQPTNVDT